MTEAEWLACEEPFPMLDHLSPRRCSRNRLRRWWWSRSRSKTSARKSRLFATACCRQVWHELGEEDWRNIAAAEDVADGAPWPEGLPDLWSKGLERPNAEWVARFVAEWLVAGNTEELDLTKPWQQSHARNAAHPAPRHLRQPLPPGHLLPRAALTPRLRSRSRCTSPATSPRCRFWPTHCKTPGATAPTSSTTAADRGRTFAGAGWWIYASGRNRNSLLLNPHHCLRHAEHQRPAWQGARQFCSEWGRGQYGRERGTRFGMSSRPSTAKQCAVGVPFCTRPPRARHIPLFPPSRLRGLPICCTPDDPPDMFR